MAILFSLKGCQTYGCLLYTSDAADQLDGVDLGSRRIIKKNKCYFGIVIKNFFSILMQE